MTARRAESFQERLNGLPDHRGQPQPDSADFFADPPAELGTLISAETTLKTGRVALTFWWRLAITGIVAAVVWAALAWLQDWNDPLGRGEPHVVAWLGVIVFGPLAWVLTRFSHTCTYVGRDGVARIRVKGSRGGRRRAEVMLFADAARLRTEMVRQHLNGIYVTTEYRFNWVNGAGRRLFAISGAFHSGKQPPRGKDCFHFASAAEEAWSEHFLLRAQEQLQAEGSIVFGVDDRLAVRVGPGFIEFITTAQRFRVGRDEIASVSLANGIFHFRHKDARWYRSAGKFTFPYAAMANAKVFLLALERLLGYSWDSPPARAA